MFVKIIPKIPKYVGMVFKPGKAALGFFTKATKGLKSSKIYKMASNLVGEPLESWVKNQVKAEFANGGVGNIVKGFAVGAGSSLAAGPARASFTSPTSLKNSFGEVVPGSLSTSQSAYTVSNSFNASSKYMRELNDVIIKSNASKKQIMDTYRRNVNLPSFKLEGVDRITEDMRVFASNRKFSLKSNLTKSDSMVSTIKPLSDFTGIDTPPNIEEKSLRSLSNYMYRSLNKIGNVLSQNNKKINENLNAVLFTLAKKQEETIASAMDNLGKYNADMYSKLVNLMTKIESISFQKQQQSDITQTGLISDKLDSTHSYMVKSTDTIRSELLLNTQAMHALHNQERALDAEYKANERRENRGLNLSNIHGMLKQIAQMVEVSFLTPEQINSNTNSVLGEFAKDIAFEVGQTVQYITESIDMFRLLMKKSYQNIDNFLKGFLVTGGLAKMNISILGKKIPIGEMLGKGIYSGITKSMAFMGKTFDWGSEVLLKGFFNASDTTAQHYGRDLSWDSNGTEGFLDFLKLEESNNKTGYNGGIYYAGQANQRGGLLKSTERVMKDDKKGNLKVSTLSGKTYDIKLERKTNQSESHYYSEAINMAREMEANEMFEGLVDELSSVNSNYRDTPKEAVKRYQEAVKVLTLDKLVVKDGKVTVSCVNKDPIEITYTPDIKKFFKSKLGKHFNEKDAVFEVHIDPTLSFFISKALKEASKKGIRYYISSTFRPPNPNTRSYHGVGMAVDIALRARNGNTLTAIVKSRWVHPNKTSIISALEDKKVGASAAAGLSEPELTRAVQSNFNTDCWVSYTPDDEKDLMTQWYELINIFKSENLNVGVNSYGAINSFIKERPVDLVHVTLGKHADLNITDKKFDNMGDELRSSSNYHESKNESVIGNILTTTAKESEQKEINKSIKKIESDFNRSYGKGYGLFSSASKYVIENGEKRKLTVEESFGEEGLDTTQRLIKRAIESENFSKEDINKLIELINLKSSSEKKEDQSQVEFYKSLLAILEGIVNQNQVIHEEIKNQNSSVTIINNSGGGSGLDSQSHNQL